MRAPPTVAPRWRFAAALHFRCVALSLALGAALCACSHDLDAFTKKNGSVQKAGSGGKGGSGGKAGSGSDQRDGGGGSGSGGSGSDMRDAGPPCAPCDELSATAKELGLRGCCRGATNDECGLTFADGTLCLPRMVPGQPNTTCPELRVSAAMRLDGCCRPDSRCGVSADGLGLGCVAREEVGVALGGTMAPSALSCEFTCVADSDCNDVLSGYECGETPDHSRRLCLKACKRDQDCQRGEICGVSNDNAMDRVLTVCRAPIGDVEPGQFCSAAKDCVHGVCITADTTCSKPCANVGECGTGFKTCAESMIPNPSGKSQTTFKICRL